jgi:hypothetical protein
MFHLLYKILRNQDLLVNLIKFKKKHEETIKNTANTSNLFNNEPEPDQIVHIVTKVVTNIEKRLNGMIIKL